MFIYGRECRVEGIKKYPLKCLNLQFFSFIIRLRLNLVPRESQKYNNNDSLWNLIRAPGHVSEITFKVCCNLYETAAVVSCSPGNFANAM